MADNYLEKRYEELYGAGSGKKTIKRTNPSLDSLLVKNRSYRGYLKEHVVRRDELEKIVSVNTRIASGNNRQALRFRLVTKGEEADKVNSLIKMGAALPELQLPFAGTEPEAFIVVCTTVPENKIIDIDLGISLQSMTLKAVEMGLNGLMMCAFDKDGIKSALNLDLEPLAVLAIGKGAEKIQLLSIKENEDHKYYRKDGIHYVPKVDLKDLIVG